MDKTIENEFFKAYAYGGLLNECFYWLGVKYGLTESTKRVEDFSDKDQHYYEVELPQIITNWADAMSDKVRGFDSPLLDEIISNVKSVDEVEREDYIYSLLEPFNEFGDIMGYGIDKLEYEICDLRSALAEWEEVLKNPQYDYEREDATMQIEFYRKWIAEKQSEIKRKTTLQLGYISIFNQAKKNTVEYGFKKLIQEATVFGTKLDARLLKCRIHLLWYQEESDIRLIKSHNYIALSDYFHGSMKLVEKAIDEALPKLNGKQREADDSPKADAVTSSIHLIIDDNRQSPQDCTTSKIDENRCNAPMKCQGEQQTSEQTSISYNVPKGRKQTVVDYSWIIETDTDKKKGSSVKCVDM